MVVGVGRWWWWWWWRRGSIAVQYQLHWVSGALTVVTTARSRCQLIKSWTPAVCGVGQVIISKVPSEAHPDPRSEGDSAVWCFLRFAQH